MKIYLVGGAVRDLLMGNIPKDRDYVVVEATSEQMIEMGFVQVGADFPVFLKNNEEYALARKEVKNGSSYCGFDVDANPNVTLEVDLQRRDLTINSIAYDVELDNIIDPFGGNRDIQREILRHTSEAFTEDPVRVLRVARFMARFGSSWTIADETKTLIRSMAKKGVLKELTSERVWKEMSRALMEPFPRLFFDTLLELDCLHIIFPEIYKLITALEIRKWHPEGNAYEHTMLVLTQAANRGFDLKTRFAALVHDFGKGVTKFEDLPNHYGHDVNGVPVVEKFCDRLTVPSIIKQYAKKATRFHMMMHKLDEMKPSTIAQMINDLEPARFPHIVQFMIDVATADQTGRLGFEEADVSKLHILVDFFNEYDKVKFINVFPNGETDPNKIKNGMFHARVAVVKAIKGK